MKKYTCNFGRLVAMILIFSLCFSFNVLATSYDDTDIVAEYIDSDGTTYIFDEVTGEYLPVVNIEEEIAEISANHDPEVSIEQRRSPGSVGVSSTAATASGIIGYSAVAAPVPGGVGYGVMMYDSFWKNFTYGTRISYDIVCPKTAGGNNGNFLYLTSKNRAALGVEAYVSYYAQNTMEFVIFDWAMPESERWVVFLSYDNLTNYFETRTINGANYQTLHVINCTVRTANENQWRNKVYLKSVDTAYLIYSYTYSATLEAQKTAGDNQMWGPIVETFQDSYSNLNMMGFNGAFVCAYKTTMWPGILAIGEGTFLNESNSWIRNDNKGYTLQYLSPNHTFLVR